MFVKLVRVTDKTRKTPFCSYVGREEHNGGQVSQKQLCYMLTVQTYTQVKEEPIPLVVTAEQDRLNDLLIDRWLAHRGDEPLSVTIDEFIDLHAHLKGLQPDALVDELMKALSITPIQVHWSTQQLHAVALLRSFIPFDYEPTHYLVVIKKSLITGIIWMPAYQLVDRCPIFGYSDDSRALCRIALKSPGTRFILFTTRMTLGSEFDVSEVCDVQRISIMFLMLGCGLCDYILMSELVNLSYDTQQLKEHFPQDYEHQKAFHDQLGQHCVIFPEFEEDDDDEEYQS